MEQKTPTHAESMVNMPFLRSVVDALIELAGIILSMILMVTIFYVSARLIGYSSTEKSGEKTVTDGSRFPYSDGL